MMMMMVTSFSYDRNIRDYRSLFTTTVKSHSLLIPDLHEATWMNTAFRGLGCVQYGHLNSLQTLRLRFLWSTFQRTLQDQVLYR